MGTERISTDKSAFVDRSHKLLDDGQPFHNPVREGWQTTQE
jgi:hypothetical protein